MKNLLIKVMFLLMLTLFGISVKADGAYKKYVDINWVIDMKGYVDSTSNPPVVTLPLRLKISIDEHFEKFRFPENEDYAFDWVSFYNDIKVPFVAVGDFNHDKLSDIAVLLLGEGKAGVWKLVIFHGSANTFQPVVLLSSPGFVDDDCERLTDFGPVQRNGILLKNKCRDGNSCLNFFVYESANYEFIWRNGYYEEVNISD